MVSQVKGRIETQEPDKQRKKMRKTLTKNKKMVGEKDFA